MWFALTFCSRTGGRRTFIGPPAAAAERRSGMHSNHTPRRRIAPLLAGFLVGWFLCLGTVLALRSKLNEATVEKSQEALSSEASDAIAEVRVRFELLTKLGWDGLRVHPHAHAGNVVLTGEVKKRSTQEIAEEVALSVDGVNKVDDQVRVVPSTQPEPPVARAAEHVEDEFQDALLEARVKGRLLEQMGTNALHLEVEASDGVVSLRGTVPSEEHLKLAVATAKKTKGVRQLVDLLEVRS
jgi:hyperosmotically inducible periplasmic protein